MAQKNDNLGDVLNIIKEGPIAKEDLAKRIKKELPHIASYQKVLDSLNKRGLVSKSADDIYSANAAAISTSKAPQKKAKVRTTLNYNPDLPKEIIKNTEGIIVDNKANAACIRKTVTTHEHYAYTGFIKDVFLCTVPPEGKQPSVNDIIARLVCIDTIDGTNLSKGSVRYGFKAFAESIFNANLEDLIRNNKPISNELFVPIAKRISIANENKSKKFFSAITKYIARTAYYCYDIENGYPIYDEVLRKHLHLYIKGFSPSAISALKKKCDYEHYCGKINSYLEERNKSADKKDQLTNIEFDQIIWFSYKAQNAKPKYK